MAFNALISTSSSLLGPVTGIGLGLVDPAAPGFFADVELWHHVSARGLDRFVTI
ncbi:hypothetical protein [Glutamicibacter sp.]|uniref:hypothetical protein n=1 Tax=Glutamicibacter sp. TaxID=1931995 RepID=UPI002B4A2B04|nr:hypothetical protein [Glutamicibacter sp.]HJX79390.1 hypothetical protein [Glutamicibacter sp.]